LVIGLTIAYSLGIFERALQPFPAALEFYRNVENANGGDALPRVPADRQVSPTKMKVVSA
jgi:hypothetical protein